jgi:D-3-phosphoglycerate dehydrogenase / 2-oxoglutarate reductase
MHTHILEPLDYSPIARAQFQALGSVSEGEDAQGLGKADILVIRLGTFIDATFLKRCAHVKYILSATTGTDHLDTNAIQERGIKLICLKGETDFLGSIPSTAEHTWALMLSLLRNIVPASGHVIAGGWNRNLFRGNNIRGKRLGVLGLGRVGKQVATFAKAFGMQVFAYDTNPNQTAEGVSSLPSFEELAKACDILSIHIPLDASTMGWLNASRLGQLSREVYIVNTSRGGVWHESALCDLIASGHVAGVATDVLQDELVPEQRSAARLIDLAKSGKYRILITPHIAGATFESMAMTEEFVVKKFLEVLHHVGNE